MSDPENVNQAKQRNDGSAQNKPPIQESTSAEDTSKQQGIVTAIDKFLESSDSNTTASGEQGGHPGFRAKQFIPAVLVICLGVGVAKYINDQEQLIRDPTIDQPRLAHVVGEYQGTRRINLIGGAVMVLTGLGGMLAMMVYRRVRIEKARLHDSMFWFLAMMSLFFGCIFTIWRWRRRRQDAVRSALDAMARSTNNMTRYSAFTVPAIPIVMFLYLLYYRNQKHKTHARRRKARNIHHDKADIM